MAVHIPIVGDIRLVLRSLNDQCDAQAPTLWKETLAGWREPYLPPAPKPGFVEPTAFLRLLSEKVDEKCILVADVGQNQIWSANHFRVKKGRFLTTGGLGTMGYSLPAAMGVKLAKPERQVVAICGDGSFQMSMNELGTMVQEQVPVKIVIMENERLGMVREVQDTLYNGRYAATILDNRPDFAVIAQAYGLPARVISSNEEAGAAIDEWLGAETAALLVCRVSPDTACV